MNNLGKKFIVITTVNKPTDNFKESFYKLIKKQNWSIVVVGDVSTPSEWENEKELFYLSLEKQVKYFPEISKLIPLKHYSRKNLGYLFAILNGAQVILDTDDNNARVEIANRNRKYVLENHTVYLRYKQLQQILKKCKPEN